MHIRPHAEMSRDEVVILWQAERTENESLRQQLAEAHAIIDRRDAVIRLLEADIESIGAGGVSSQRITGSDQANPVERADLLQKTLDDVAAGVPARDAEIARLQRIIDSRPALNAGLVEAYIEWTQSIYAMEIIGATETEQ